MFPPLLCLVLLFGLVPCFPLGVFPLPLLTLKKRLYLREQDAGQSLYLMVGYPGSIVVGFLLAWHGITPLEPFLVKQIALEYCSISRYETAPCVFWYLLGGAGVVENDLRKHTIRSAANTEIHVVAYLAGDDGRIRPLRGKNEMNTKCPSLPRNGGQLVFNLCQQLLPFLLSYYLFVKKLHSVSSSRFLRHSKTAVSWSKVWSNSSSRKHMWHFCRQTLGKSTPPLKSAM